MSITFPIAKNPPPIAAWYDVSRLTELMERPCGTRTLVEFSVVPLEVWTMSDELPPSNTFWSPKSPYEGLVKFHSCCPSLSISSQTCPGDWDDGSVAIVKVAFVIVVLRRRSTVVLVDVTPSKFISNVPEPSPKTSILPPPSA